MTAQSPTQHFVPLLFVILTPLSSTSTPSFCVHLCYFFLLISKHTGPFHSRNTVNRTHAKNILNYVESNEQCIKYISPCYNELLYKSVASRDSQPYSPAYKEKQFVELKMFAGFIYSKLIGYGKMSN